MGIAATELSVHDYRNYESCTLGLGPQVTVLVGENAVGKTNLVEGLQLLTSGSSFRRPAPRELVRDGASRARAELTLEGDGRLLTHGLEVADGKRSFSRNGKRVAASGVRGVVPSVLFCPDHLDMIKRSASVRRSALDDFGVQLSEQYGSLVTAYERIVAQRNNLLKDPHVSEGLLSAWDESLIRVGSALLMHRRSLLERIRAHFVEVHAAVAPRELADVSYRASIGEAGASREETEEAFSCALAACRADELRRGLSLVGPHRDEVEFSIDGRGAREYGSQGQQRTLVLAWKIAEVEVTRDVIGRPPLLLLDDVMSELDAARRDAIMNFVGDDIQTVITTTNLGYFDAAALAGAKVVYVGHGAVS